MAMRFLMRVERGDMAAVSLFQRECGKPEGAICVWGAKVPQMAIWLFGNGHMAILVRCGSGRMVAKLYCVCA